MSYYFRWLLTIQQSEQDWPLNDTGSHINNIGRMIEEMEIKMRNLLQEVGSFPAHGNTEFTST